MLVSLNNSEKLHIGDPGTVGRAWFGGMGPGARGMVQGFRISPPKLYEGRSSSSL